MAGAGVPVSPPEGRRVFSVPEAAAYLGVSTWTVYQRVKRGELPHVRIGARIAVPQFELDRWLSARARHSIGEAS